MWGSVRQVLCQEFWALRDTAGAGRFVRLVHGCADQLGVPRPAVTFGLADGTPNASVPPYGHPRVRALGARGIR
jgi:hypothetical protein